MHSDPNSNPLVSVVVPVFNNHEYLRRALLSILHQTYRNLEIIVVDDGSTDNSLSAINAIHDNRIVVLKNEKNRGIAFSLNAGIAKAQGELIARMDADDIALPDRIQRQVNYLCNHSRVGIVGSAAYQIDANERIKKIIFSPETDIEIRCCLPFMAPFIHPTVMIRKKILTNFNLWYDEQTKFAQDYGLWCRVLDYTAGYNLPIPLLKYRHHAKSISVSKKIIQQDIGNGIRKEYLYKFMEKRNVDRIDLNCMLDIVGGRVENRSKNELKRTYQDIVDIIQTFSRHYQLREKEEHKLIKIIIHPILSNLLLSLPVSRFSGFTCRERLEILVFLLQEAIRYKYMPKKRAIKNRLIILQRGTKRVDE